MKKFLLICVITLFCNLALANLSPQNSAQSSWAEDYPPPHKCQDPTAITQAVNFCQCFIEQSIIGCKYATDNAFYCKETFINSQITMLSNNDDAILKFCIKYKGFFPQDKDYDEKVCLGHVKYYKNNC